MQNKANTDVRLVGSNNLSRVSTSDLLEESYEKPARTYLKSPLQLVIFSLLVLSLQSCDGIYSLKILADLPTDQDYRLSIERIGQGDAWTLSENDNQLITSKNYRGLSMIYENQKIGPGINQPDVAQLFWNTVGSLTFTGQVDGAIYKVTKSDVVIYRESRNDILIMIKIKKGMSP